MKVSRTTTIFAAAAALLLAAASCQKPSTIILSQKSLDLTSAATSRIVSSTTGIVLDEIRVNGKEVSSRSQTSRGELQLTYDWITVVTPNAASGETVNSIKVTVTSNLGSSTREADILVHDPVSRQSETIKVKQTCPKDESSGK